MEKKTSQEGHASGNSYNLNLEASQPADSTEFSLAAQHDQLERGLKSRHIQFLALGGAIGTGLFVGSGAILSSCGPAPLFMAYIFMMAIVWTVMNCLAEMVTLLPMRGITVPYFVERFVDPSLAFAAGWNYWYVYAILVGAEASAASIVIDYWPGAQKVPVAVWITIILIVMLFLNIIAVQFFGEAEFWFASIKLISIMGLIILGIVIFFGGGPNQDHIRGFYYWEHPGAFVQYKGVAGSTGRFLAFWHAFIAAGFAFITSPELIAIAAGETVAPRRNIPKAARRFVWRLAIFYGCGSLVIGILVASNDDQLLGALASGASGAAASPFVIGIQRVGISVLNHIINATILTSAWSAGNSFLYSGSRVLYSMSLTGNAPRFFSKTTRLGVPWVAVLATFAVSLLSYLNVDNSGEKVFTWFVNLSTISGYIAWIIVMITYVRFRKALEYNNALDIRPYKTPLQPYASYFMIGLVSLLTITNGFQTFMAKPFVAADFIAAYITIPIVLVLYVGHKIWFRTRLAIPVHEIDIVSGVKEMDELEQMDEERVPSNWLQKVWYWLA
ncbi:amino-acid permease inda1 [Cordyceps fumosorosea ARSEF 2679]|uniref:Amino-acid permease inda1 n=1 Tax=Cordyceps fumosorosea (strain ARSEF 2679) TaxID=1081104 RepID=A0A167TJX9_CORFA|nr:amino-acid permease inda1 [Cordyceps fumosorosea ARSEF 2679]OAA60677.1 amino-acid permease inda1 [Cordyceps fumosorosea ARSEF 2679]